MFDEDDFGGALPDLTELTLVDLAELDRDVLAREVRALCSAEISTRVRASFNAFIGMPTEDVR
jgi:hypothetical protein